MIFMEIKFYSTHCPKCSVLEKKMKSKNISYEEINDVETMKAKGIESVPMLEIDDTLMNFAEAVRWVNMQEE